MEYLVLRGSALARLEKWDETGRSLTKALDLYPNQAGAYLNLGLYYLELGKKEIKINEQIQFDTASDKILPASDWNAE